MRLNRLVKNAIAVLLLLAILSMHRPVLAADAGAGFVDQVFASRNSVRLVGWAVDGGETVQPGRIAIYFGETRVYEGDFERTRRPDVVRAYGKPGWLLAGISVDVALPPTIKGGKHSVRAEMSFSGGQRLTLEHEPGAESVVVPHRDEGASWIVLPVLLFAAIAACVLFARSASIARHLQVGICPALHDWHLACAAPVLLFAILIGFGITGSSIALLSGGTPLTTTDEIALMGSDQAIRSDEWLLFTPYAVAQTKHSPPFPVINRNLGPEGQNMLVLGMGGVPVWHWSALAKPATWGFFVLDLKRALAWYWWFPLFGCFGAVWALLAALSCGQWRVSALLALGFVASPTIAAWSNWPAYVAMFPAAAAALFIALLREERKAIRYACTVGLGMCVAGGVLTLYPAWQVPLAYLVAMVVLMHLVSERLLSRILVRWPALLLGATVALLVLVTWWYDARDAIATMLATVYPGQRASVAGGSIEPWYLARGLANIQTMFVDLMGVSNSSETSSFLYVFPPIVLVLLVDAIRARRVPIAFLGVLGFLALAVGYQFLGFPVSLAEISLWGRTTPDRVDLSVGLAQTILLSLWLKHLGGPAESRCDVIARVAVPPALLWGALLFYWLRSAPPGMSQWYSVPSALLMSAFAALVSWSLLARGHRLGLIMLAGFGTSISLAFNPMKVAPGEFRSMDVRSLCGVPRDRPMPRMLTVGSQVWIGSQVPAIALFASGVPVVNGIYYYPQLGLWKDVDPAGKQVNTYNRYHHLLFFPTDSIGATPTIEAPRSDVVKVQVDLASFEFAKFGATCVAGASEQTRGAAANARLRHTGDHDSWSFYAVE